MSASEVAADHYADRVSLTNAAGEAAVSIWSEVDPARIVESYTDLLPELTAVTSGAQLAAARQAEPYVGAALAEQGIEDEGLGLVDPAGFSGQASDGRGLVSLLSNPMFVALGTIADGNDILTAMAAGRANLDMMVRTQVADAGRLADSVATTRRPKAEGWIRLAMGKSCARCLILSGKFFRWNEGFQRHPRCLPAGAVVSGPMPIATTRRWFEGELRVIRTASGEELAITGNHPVLTDRGWLPANLVQPGDYVVRSVLREGATPLVVPDERQVPARIEDLWRPTGVLGLRGVPTAAEDFHGDGGHGEVDIEFADGLLRHWMLTASSQPLVQFALSLGLESAHGFDGESVGDLLLGSPDGSARGGMGSLGLRHALLGGHLRGAHLPGLGRSASGDPGERKAALDYEPADAVAEAEAELALAGLVRRRNVGVGQNMLAARWDAPIGPLTVQNRAGYAARGQDLLLRLAGQVTLDRVIENSGREFRGHVYNLTSTEGWFVASGLIVSNCDCIHTPAGSGRARFSNPDIRDVYDSMTRAERLRAGFTLADQKAIADGADITSLVNARHRPGALATAGGRKVTLEGTTRRGIYGKYRIDPATGGLVRRVDAAGKPLKRGTLPPRLSVDEVYDIAGDDRELAVALLGEYSYLRLGAVAPVVPSARTVDLVTRLPRGGAGAVPTPRPRKAAKAAAPKPAPSPGAAQPEVAAEVRAQLADLDTPTLRRVATALQVPLSPSRLAQDQAAAGFITLPKAAKTKDEIVDRIIEGLIRPTQLRPMREVQQLLDDALASARRAPGAGDIAGAVGRLSSGGMTEGEIVRLLDADAGLTLPKLREVGGQLGVDMTAARSRSQAQLLIAQARAGKGAIPVKATKAAPKPAPSPYAKLTAPKLKALTAERDLAGLADGLKAPEVRKLLDRFDAADAAGRRAMVAEAKAKAAAKVAQAETELRAALGGGTPTVDQIVQSRTTRGIAEAVEGDFAGLRVQVTESEITAHGITFRGVVLDADGKRVGTFVRAVERDEGGELVARHSALYLRPEARDRGFAEAFNEHLNDWYRRSGVTRVELPASEVGAYVWAAQGYQFADAEAARKFLASASDKIEQALSAGTLPAGVSRAELLELRKYVDDIRAGRRAASAPEISQFGRQAGQAGADAVWPGKWLMVDSEWDGVLRLDAAGKAAPRGAALDPVKLRAAVAKAKKAGVEVGPVKKVGTVTPAGKSVKYDPKVHQLPDGATAAAGAKVRVVEPGYQVQIGRETVWVRRPQVELVPEAPKPVKAASRAATAELTGTGARGLSADAAGRAAQIDNRVRQATRDLIASGRTVAGQGDYVALADIREHALLRDLDRGDVDSALRRLQREPGTVVIPETEQAAVSQRVRDASVRLGGQDRHYIAMDDTSLRPLPVVKRSRAK